MNGKFFSYLFLLVVFVLTVLYLSENTKVNLGHSETVDDNSFQFQVQIESGIKQKGDSGRLQSHSGRLMERCFATASEIVVSHGTNGDCFILDVNGNYWLVNPYNLRTLLSKCPTKIEESAKLYNELDKPSDYWPPSTNGQYPKETLDEYKCNRGIQ